MEIKGWILSVLMALGGEPATQSDEGLESPEWPRHILLTNDNGVEDPKLIALGRALAERSRVTIVAPDRDRSGSSTYLQRVPLGSLDVSYRELEAGLRLFSVNGTPADCVVLAYCGILRDDRPDLVVSGINGGPNLGTDWLFSGTIGAARVAALGGVPAIAVSGLNDDLPGSVAAATKWVTSLVGSEVVRTMSPGRYLTVSLPRVLPDAIRGIRVVRRDRTLTELVFVQEKTPSDEEALQQWQLVGSLDPTTVGPDSDRHWVDRGWIAVVPMTLNEQDTNWLESLSKTPELLPKWSPK